MEPKVTYAYLIHFHVELKVLTKPFMGELIQEQELSARLFRQQL